MEARLRLLGTGSSAGIPILGCSCKVCCSCKANFSSKNKNIRTRSSLLISSGGKNLVIDTCPDFRYQMLREGIDHLDSVIYTHIHFDHISGFDDIRAYSFWDSYSTIDVYIPDMMYELFLTRYSYFLGKNISYKGTCPRVAIRKLPTPKTCSSILSFHLDCFDIDVEYFCFKHSNTDVFAYRFGRFLYLTDFKYLDSKIVDQLKGKIDFAVISGINFKKEHFIHSTIDETQELLDKLQVNKAVITHICHDVDYYDPDNIHRLKSGVSLGYDGMSVDINM